MGRVSDAVRFWDRAEIAITRVVFPLRSSDEVVLKVTKSFLITNGTMPAVDVEFCISLPFLG